MLLVSFKNFSSWYNIFKKNENFSLNNNKLYYKRYKKKPILLAKIFITLSKKSMRNLRLDNFFNITRQQRLFFANLHSFKYFYKRPHRFQNKYKANSMLKLKYNFFFIKNIPPFFLEPKPKNTLRLKRSKYFLLQNEFVTKLSKKLKLKKFICFKRSKYKYNITKINRRGIQHYKVSFFRRFKYKYGIRRKKFLKKKFLSYFSKIKRYSRLKLELKQYIIYNSKKKLYKISYRLKKKTSIGKRSHFILPRLLLLETKCTLNTVRSIWFRLKFQIVSPYYVKTVHLPTSVLTVFNTNFKNKNLLHIRKKQRYSTQQKSVIFKTNHRSSFIIRNVGLVFPIRSVYNYTNFELYRVRKKVYSFLKRNEYKAHIFNFRKKQILWKNFFYNKKDFMVNAPRLNYEFFKRDFYLESRISTNKFNSTNLLNETIFTKNNFFHVKNKNQNNFFNEVRVPRIRFKPGYQRLWRDFRRALVELLSYRHTYQKQLTNYLTRFYRKINKSYISQEENSIDKILLYSKLLPDAQSLNSFFKNNMIFLNSKKLTSLAIYVYKNDFIQIEISNWYYIFSRWLFKLTRNRNLKLKRLVFKKGMSTRYKLMKQKKQRSNYTPNWITNSKYDFQDIKSFLEVDFMTLSLFIIYDYNHFFYYTPIDLKLVNYNVYKMYNWKYLT